MKMKYALAALLLALTLGLLSSCAGPSAQVGLDPELPVSYPAAIGFDDYEARRQLRDDNPLSEDFLAALGQFSYTTGEALLTGATDNANFSPLSLYYALSLAALGAEGDTQAQLLEALGVSDPTELAGECGALYRLLYRDNEIGQLKIANSLWLDNEILGQPISFKEGFLTQAAQELYAEAYSVDFSDPSAGESMGAWISRHTNGTLSPELPVDDQQLLAIVNTVYFYDEWVDRFDKSRTEADIFHTLTGEVEAEFMNQEFGSAGFGVGEGFTRSQLGLKNAGSMIFVLPDSTITVEDLLAKAGLETLLYGGEQYHGEVIWSIPKFSFAAKYELADTLQALGVTSAFSQQTADFSPITEDAPVWIGQVTQETHIAIDENGVEASAFTRIDYAGAAPPEGRAEMVLDRPFLYAITASNGALLFVGVCNDPTAQ